MTRLLHFVLVFVIVLAIDVRAAAPLSGNPQSATLRLDRHDDYNPRDLHAVVSTVGIWWHTRFTRMGDAALDALLPGAPPRPIESTLEAVRQRYHRWGLSRFTPTRRVGDLFKALLLHELSPSNVTLGSHLERTQAVIDLAQLVVADCGDLAARPFGGRAMSVLKYPYWPIDLAQAGVDRAVHEVLMSLGRIGDGLLFRIERLADPRRPVPVSPPTNDLIFSN